jgi:hypothetical protein
VEVDTYKTGRVPTLVDHGRIRRYTGLVEDQPAGDRDDRIGQLRIDRMAKGLPVDAPWTAKRRSGTHVGRIDQALRGPPGRHDLFEMAAEG